MLYLELMYPYCILFRISLGYSTIICISLASLSKALGVLQEFENDPHYLHLASPTTEIGFSIRIMIQLIGRYLEVSANADNSETSRRGAHPIIPQRLASCGWHPSSIQRINGSQNNCLGYYPTSPRPVTSWVSTHAVCGKQHIAVRWVPQCAYAWS